MMYALIPHTGIGIRFFTTYSAAEQAVLTTARSLTYTRGNPNWCELIAYDGFDELVPVFSYTIVDDNHLRRTTL